MQTALGEGEARQADAELVGERLQESSTQSVQRRFGGIRRALAVLLRTRVAVWSVVPEYEDQPLASRPILSAVAFAGGEPVSEARHAARDFLSDAQAVHGVPVSDRAVGMVQLVVSELVTNAQKYAPGPCLLDLEISDGAVEISVWDTDPTLPVAQAADPGRVGQHGLEIVIGACHSFEMRREPVGKRIRAAVVLADDPGGDPGGRPM